MANLTLSFNLVSNPEIKKHFEMAKEQLSKEYDLRLTNTQTLDKVLKFYLSSGFERLIDEET